MGLRPGLRLLAAALAFVAAAAGPLRGQTPATVFVDSVRVLARGFTPGQTGGRVEVSVRNTGPGTATELSGALSIRDGQPGFTVRPASGNATSVASGASAVLTFVVDVASSLSLGHARVAATVTAKDGSSGNAATVVSTPPSDSRVRRPAVVEVVKLMPVQSSVTQGQTTPTAVQVTFAAPASWVATAPATRPPARRFASAAFDPVRDRIVLFGGLDAGGQPLADTWEWNGARWVAASPASRPGARSGHAMAYDEAGRRILLFGGESASALQGDTWAYDGTTWSPLTPAVPPPARARHAMATHPGKGRVVLFGGTGASGRTSDTWQWNGAAWSEATTAPSPAAREGHGLAANVARGSVLLFGGKGSTGALGDTWEWDGREWVLTEAIGPPGKRFEHAIASDPLQRVVFVAGGIDANGATLGDVWRWNGSLWSADLPAPPPAQSGGTLEFDALESRLVLIGGRRTGGALADDTRSRASRPPATGVTATLIFEGDESGYSVRPDPRNPDSVSSGERQELSIGASPRGTAALGPRVIRATAAARDGLTGGPATVTSTPSTNWVVQAPAQLTVRRVTIARATATRGQTGISVVVSVENTTPSSPAAGVEGIVASLAFSRGAAGFRQTAATTFPVTVGPRAVEGIAFRLDVESHAPLGTTTLTASVAGVDGLAGSPATIVNTVSAELLVIDPPVLTVTAVAVAPAAASLGQRGLAAFVTVSNGSAQAIDAVTASLRFDGDTRFFTVAAAAGNATTVPAGQSRVLTFAVNVAANAPARTVQVTPAVTARDALTGAPASVAGAPRADLAVQSIGAITVTKVTLPPILSRGSRRAEVRVGVTNPGTPGIAAGVTDLRAGLRFGGSTSGFTIVTSPANVTALLPGASAELAFSVDAGSTAPLAALTVAAVLEGRDSNSGAPAVVDARLLGATSVRLPVALFVESFGPARARIAQGQRDLPCRLVLRNLGSGTGASAQAIAVRIVSGRPADVGVAPDSASIAALAPGAAAEVPFLLSVSSAAASGSVTLTATVTAMDSITNVPARFAGPAMATIAIERPARFGTAVLTLGAPFVTQGQTGVTAVFDVRHGGTPGTARIEGLSSTLEADRAGLGITGLAGAVVSLAPGETARLGYRIDVPPAAEPGRVIFTATASGRDANGAPATIATTPVTAAFVVQSPPSLSVDAIRLRTATVSRGQRAIELGVLVRHSGNREHGASVVALEASPRFNGSAALYGATALPGNSRSVSAGASAVLTFLVDVDSRAPAGAVTVTAVVSGRDGNSGLACGVANEASALFQVVGASAAPAARSRVRAVSGTVGGPRLLELSGTGSRGAAGDAVAAYAWTLASAPAGSAPFASSAPSIAYEAFRPGSYVFGLEIRDSAGATDQTTFGLSVSDVAPVAEPGGAYRVMLTRGGAGQTAGTTLVLELDGTRSADANRTPLTYAWRVVSGPAGGALLEAGDSARPRLSFAAGLAGTRLLAAGVYELELTASSGGQTGLRRASVLALDPGQLPPVAHAGLARAVEVAFEPGGGLSRTIPDPASGGALADFVRLDGRESADPSVRALAYAWRVVEKPSSSLLTELAEASSATPTFRPDTGGEYLFELVVTSGGQASLPSRVRLRVEVSGANRAPSPVALARDGTSVTTASSVSAPLLEVETGTRVVLDGSQSTDADAGDRARLAYEWSQLEGPTVTLEPFGTLPEVSFTALVPGSLRFGLTVRDASGAQDTAEVPVSVRRRGAAAGRRLVLTAASGGRTGAGVPAGFGRVRSLRVTVPSTVTLTGRLEGAAEAGASFEYEWVQLSGPAVSLTSAGERQSRSRESVTRFAPTTSRVHEFELVAREAGVGSWRERVRVVVDTASSRVPEAVVGTERGTIAFGGAAPGRTVQLSATEAGIALPPGVRLSYAWRQVAGPRGRIANASAAVTTFEAPDLGETAGAREVVLEVRVDALPPGDLSEPAYVSLSQASGATTTGTPGVAVVTAGAGGGAGGGCALGARDRAAGGSLVDLALLVAGMRALLRPRRRTAPGPPRSDAGSWGSRTGGIAPRVAEYPTRW